MNPKRGCRPCGSTQSTTSHLFREMMFGTRQEFRYDECDACGSLSIREIPADLGAFYPTEYYSFESSSRRARRGFFKKTAASVLMRAPHRLRDTLLPELPSIWATLHEARLDPQARILDVGCGSGELLWRLRAYGFHRLFGVDPFVPESVADDAVTIWKKQAADIDGEFDLVVSSHSLEHMPEPREAIRELERLCRPGGYVLIQVPVLGNSWLEYGRDWVELDVPRHLFVPSRSGLSALLSAASSLRLRLTRYDTTAFEFLASELYRHDLPLQSDGSGGNTNALRQQLASPPNAYRRRARAVNRDGTAGRVSVLLQRLPDASTP